MREKLAALLRTHVAAEDAHCMQDILATLHQDCIFEDTATGQIFRGRSGAAAYYQQWWDALGLVSSRETEDRTYWTEEGSHVGQGRFQGVHTGLFLGIPATVKRVNFRCVVFVSFRSGLISGKKFYYDLAALLSQIGAVNLPLPLVNS